MALLMLEQEVKLNDRLPMEAAITWDMLSAADSTIIPEKQHLYKLAGKSRVPLVEVRFTNLPKSVSGLLPHVTLRLEVQMPHGHVNPATMLLDWMIDARSTNKHDDMRRYLYEQRAVIKAILEPAPKPKPKKKKKKKKKRGDDGSSSSSSSSSEEDELVPTKVDVPSDTSQYVYARMGSSPMFEDIMPLVIETTKLWHYMRDRDKIEKHIMGLSLRYDYVVSLVDWAPFMTHVLYDRSASLLYNSERWTSAMPIEFVPVGFDRLGGKRDKRYWVSLLTRYRQENPNDTLDSNTFLIDRPHDYNLLEQETLSFVALDKRHQGRMVGYVTCTLWARHERSPPEDGKFKSAALNQFNERLKANAKSASGGKPRVDCGYDVFSIDGLHTHKEYRGLTNPMPNPNPLTNPMPIAKILVFHALEFIRQSHRELGVSLIMAGAEATATKMILTNTFGFSHYNAIKDVRWLRQQLDDYHAVRGNNGGDMPAVVLTPLKLLTREGILKELEAMKTKYQDGATENARKKLDGVIKLFRESLKKSKSDPPLNADDRWPADFMSPAKFEADVIGPIESIERSFSLTKAIGTPYLKRVAKFLGTWSDDDHYDPQDCFLFLDNGTEESFTATLEKFCQDYKNNRVPYDITDDATAIQLMDVERGAGDDGDDDDDESLMPTERDMTLYALWLQDDQMQTEPDEPRPTPVVPVMVQPQPKPQPQPPHQVTVVMPPRVETRPLPVQPTPTPPRYVPRPKATQPGRPTPMYYRPPPTTTPQWHRPQQSDAPRMAIPTIERIDQAYLDAKREYDAIIEREVQELAEKLVNEKLRPLFPYWTDERLLAYGRDQIRLRGVYKQFKSKLEWVQEKYPGYVFFYNRG